MKLKHNVKLNGLKPEMIIAVMVAESIYSKYGAELILTSVCDGKHGRGSLHYVGYAIDCRTRHLEPNVDEAIVYDLREALTDEFDVVHERTHIHIEFQPK